MAAIKHRRLSDRKNGTLGGNRARIQMLAVSICVTCPLIRLCAAARVASNKTIKTVSIERLMFSLRTISMFESTECVAPCTQGLIDVFAFLEEAHFWRRKLVAGASPEHI